MKKIVITGGHLTPALAVIEELKKRGGWEIIFLGRKHAAEGEKTPSIESEIIPELGISFFPVIAGRVPRYFSRWTIPSLMKIPLGFFQALGYLLRFRPNVVLSFGGYLSVPVILAGWILRIPILTHEQTTVKGLATRFNTFFVQKIAVSWLQTVKNFPKEKVVLTGNPIRKEIFKTKEKYLRILKFDSKLPLILVTGGNQGSHAINCAIEKILPKILPKANVVHLCGHLSARRDFERLEETRSKLPPNLKGHYHVKKYIYGEEMGTFMNKADLVISRAGINTLTELLAMGKPAIFIPYPYLYQDEQTENAKMLESLGMAEILPVKDLAPISLYNLILKMLKNIELYKKNALKAKSLVKLDAAKKIVESLEELVAKN